MKGGENIEQFVFISVTHPILTTLLQHVAKRDVEEHLIYKGMETGLTYTILQPMHYMHNFDPEMVKSTGEYRISINLIAVFLMWIQLMWRKCLNRF